MDFSKTEHIAQTLTEKFGSEQIIGFRKGEKQDHIEITAQSLLEVCAFLHEEPEFYFDFLNCLTAIDNGPEAGTLELWYHLSSIPNEISVALKITANRGNGDHLPQINSVNGIWRTADWHEREAFDLVGVHFTGHPDLRRILMPADWNGHPLRKDYQDPEEYHGIKVRYE